MKNTKRASVDMMALRAALRKPVRWGITRDNSGYVYSIDPANGRPFSIDFTGDDLWAIDSKLIDVMHHLQETYSKEHKEAEFLECALRSWEERWLDLPAFGEPGTYLMLDKIVSIPAEHIHWGTQRLLVQASCICHAERTSLGYLVPTYPYSDMVKVSFAWLDHAYPGCIEKLKTAVALEVEDDALPSVIFGESIAPALIHSDIIPGNVLE